MPNASPEPGISDKPRRNSDKLTVLTVGHSTWSLEEFVRLLQAHDVARVVDVRTVPRSRHNPQFNRETLPTDLAAAGIGYTHMRSLGGLRRALPNSPNAGWHNDTFRGYADYMLSVEFGAAVEQLIELAWQERVAVMCAEAVPWRCHRSLLADALTVRGIAVEHIMSETQRDPHEMTPFAQVNGTTITYPAPAPQQPSLEM